MKPLLLLINKIKDSTQAIEFDEVINAINDNYIYTPRLFKNGKTDDCITNQAQENEGSCKIFSFAQLHQLTEFQTLNCFGKYYRDEVLNYPDKTNHANIRTFMKYGWDHIQFDGDALTEKSLSKNKV